MSLILLVGCRGLLGQVEYACSLADIHGCNTPMFSVKLATGGVKILSGLKSYWVIWQCVESHRTKQKQTFRHGTHISKQNRWLYHCFSEKQVCELPKYLHIYYGIFTLAHKKNIQHLINNKGFLDTNCSINTRP